MSARPPVAMSAEHAFREVRQTLREALGAETILALHRRNALLDNVAVLFARGVVERHSYWQLLAGWLLAAWPHRTLWPLPSDAASRPREQESS